MIGGAGRGTNGVERRDEGAEASVVFYDDPPDLETPQSSIENFIGSPL